MSNFNGNWITRPEAEKMKKSGNFHFWTNVFFALSMLPLAYFTKSWGAAAISLLFVFSAWVNKSRADLGITLLALMDKAKVPEEQEEEEQPED